MIDRFLINDRVKLLKPLRAIKCFLKSWLVVVMLVSVTGVEAGFTVG
jgi:hypothetical protein